MKTSAFRTFAPAAAALALSLAAASAQAAPVFQGRLADGTPSSTCTVSGPGKCTYFYDTVLDITILNNWRIGFGTWSDISAPGSAQAVAAAAGLDASGLTGWVLPTGDGDSPAGALNQFQSILNSAGGTFSSLLGQFDGVVGFAYWTGSAYAPIPSRAWAYEASNNSLALTAKAGDLYTVAIRPGDIAAETVPEPASVALVGLALAGLALSRRRDAGRAAASVKGSLK